MTLSIYRFSRDISKIKFHPSFSIIIILFLTFLNQITIAKAIDNNSSDTNTVELIYLTKETSEKSGINGRKLTGFRTDNNDLAVVFTSDNTLKLLLYGKTIKKVIDIRYDMAGFVIEDAASLIDREGNYHLFYLSNTHPISVNHLVIDQLLNYQITNFFNYSADFFSLPKLEAIIFNNMDQEIISCIDSRNNGTHYNINLFSPEIEDSILFSLNKTIVFQLKYYAINNNGILLIALDFNKQTENGKIRVLQILNYNITEQVLIENKTFIFGENFNAKFKFDPINLSYLYYIPEEGAINTDHLYLRFLDNLQNERKLTFPTIVHEDSQLLIDMYNNTQLITRVPYSRENPDSGVFTLVEGNFNTNDWKIVQTMPDYLSTLQMSDFLGVGRIMSKNISSTDFIFTTNGFPNDIIKKYTIKKINDPSITDGTGLVYIGTKLSEEEFIFLDSSVSRSSIITPEIMIIIISVGTLSVLILITLFIRLKRKRIFNNIE